MNLRVLLIDFNTEKSNPTNRRWRQLFRDFADVTYYGPGFSDSFSLSLGIAGFVKRYGPFDVVVSSEHLFYNSLPDVDTFAQYDAFRNGYIFDFNIEDAIRWTQQNLGDFLELDVPKILSHFDFDYYNMRDSHLDFLNQTESVVIGWGSEFISGKAELPEMPLETFAGKANENWLNFVSQNSHRVCSLPAFVGLDEFIFRSTRDRKALISIPGVAYSQRRLARHLLDRAGVAWRGKATYRTFALITKLDQGALSRPQIVKHYNKRFSRDLAASKTAFTCGSGMQFPIRKYFEIPASGAMLVSPGYKWMRSLGFQDRVNFAEADANGLLGLLSESAKNDADVQQIALNGQLHVLRNHSDIARSRQLEAVIEKCVGGSFLGSAWVDGQFVLY